MTLLYNPDPLPRADSIVYDTPSGLGGSYTVQIVAEDGPRRLVQTIYGTMRNGIWERWDDCLQFWVDADQLSNRRRFRPPG